MNKQFIEEVAKFAVKNYPKYQILPSLTIAQAILESNWGKSGLTQKNKNLFGIKGKGGDFETKEFINGKWVTISAGFRKYDTFEGSIQDHNELLNKPRYSKVKGEKDYIKACKAVHAAGYATDPTYSDKLIKIIQRLKLVEYDKQAFALLDDDKPKPDAEKPKKDAEAAKPDAEKGISKKDADAIIKIFQRAWASAKTQEERNEIHRLANEFRQLAGIKEQ